MENNISKWDICEYQGKLVEVIAVDSDPTANVWVNPVGTDESLFVPGTELTLVEKYQR
ncbi:hypothetical protein SEA_ZENITSU_54 [Microbacterium phage Zenitsu]|uniref:Uncharacterized protein n=1 Tax=Microbacterium phage MCubed TaxID=2593339 RepID=A0A514U434_9CAUD|nr:hypothetical protein SEA_MCUBED_54 [Microbacterium phage MCubed]WNN93855.1 hypothetical protein SEA_ZENITSU_54 [Microbacterium phage Zenitsu]